MNPNAAAFAFILQQRRDMSDKQAGGTAQQMQQQQSQSQGYHFHSAANSPPVDQKYQYPAVAYSQQSYNISQQQKQNNSFVGSSFQNQQPQGYNQQIPQQNNNPYAWQQQPHQQTLVHGHLTHQQQWQQQSSQPAYTVAQYGSSSSYSASNPAQYAAPYGSAPCLGNGYQPQQQQQQQQQHYPHPTSSSFGVTSNIAATLSGISGNSGNSNNFVNTVNKLQLAATASSKKIIQNAKSSSSSSSSGSNAPVEPAQMFYCEGCDKEFTQKTAYEAHCANHETCRHPGCKFSGTKKVVIAHFHGSHGLYR